MKATIFQITLTFLFLFTAIPTMAENPLLGVGGISANSPRALQLSLIFEEGLLATMEQTGSFALVNTQLLKSELVRFNCLEEKCMLRFAADSGMNLFITGDIDDRGDEIILNMSAYGMDFPFSSKMFYHYKISIPVSGAVGAREYAYIVEEHVARFAAGTLRRWEYPTAFKIENGSITVAGQAIPDGDYAIYRKGKNDIPAVSNKAGSVKVKNGKITALDYADISAGDFILLTSKEQATPLEANYYGRKKEVVFANTTWDEKLYMAVFMPLGSAAMPFVSPVMGYFMSADWPGLAMWSVNAIPYICVEASAFINRPSTYKDDGRDISKVAKTNYYFAWYMLLSGGGSLFIDAFANQYLKNASMYVGGPQSYMGSDFLTGYLALTTAGGGHFYKGYRSWGYAYFHASNLLVYGMLWQFSASERMGSDGVYHKGSISKKRGYVFAGVLGALKLTEFIHALMLPYRIQNGTEIASEEPFSIMPAFVAGYDGTPGLGLQFSLQF